MKKVYTRKKKKERRPRICDICGLPYHRRNLVEAWDQQNPGRRVGWQKTKLRICTNCQGPKQSNRMLKVASVRLVGKREKTA